MHSHLIPGIDDGCKTLAESIQIIRAFSEMGIQKMITTPHIMSEYFPNEPADILHGLQVLKEEIRQLNIPIEIDAAAEYFIDEQFVRQLEENKPLLTFGDQLLLIEVSTFVINPTLSEVVFNLKTAGYQPVLAHPERYVYYEKPLSIFNELVSAGCYLQMNLMSLVGKYGKKEKELAIQLLSNDLIHLIGSDIHRPSQLEVVQKVLRSKEFVKWLDPQKMLNAQL